MDIYAGAFLTISAAISPHVQHGFLYSLKDPSHQTATKRLMDSDNPLYYRGWALQERVLSRRVLIFSKNGMFWECQEYDSMSYVQLQCFPCIPRYCSWRLKRGCPYEDWVTIVEDYTRRMLILEQDNLPALSGLAMLYHHLTKHDYLAGMWKQSLVFELLWRSPPSLSADWDLPSNHTAPSWSWASANGAIDHTIVETVTDTTKVLSTQIELKDPQVPFGEVMGGSIVLCGPLVPESEVDLQVIDVWKDKRTPLSKTQQSQGKIWYMLLRIDFKGQGHGLILEGGQGANQSYFIRIGAFGLMARRTRSYIWVPPSADVFAPFTNCENSTITII